MANFFFYSTPGSGAKPLPPPPDRQTACSIRTRLQGLTYPTQQYGNIPAGWITLLSDDDIKRACDAHHAVGDTHVPCGISGSYKEGGTLWPPALTNGADYTNNLPLFKRQLVKVLEQGILPEIPLAGDGESVNDNPAYGQYNDPVGSTYGYQWLMRNFERIALALKGDANSACPDGLDLTAYCPMRPGWDGIFYGWEPSNIQVPGFGNLFRQILPNGYLAIEHGLGTIPIGNGPRDYAPPTLAFDKVPREARGAYLSPLKYFPRTVVKKGAYHAGRTLVQRDLTLAIQAVATAPQGCMQVYDTLLSEFDSNLHQDNFWQIADRLLGPAWVRPSDMPPNDDPRPPYYLAWPTARGPIVPVFFEWKAYQWTRGLCSAGDVQADRNYGVGCGYPYGC